MSKARRRSLAVGVASKPTSRVVQAMGRSQRSPGLLGGLLARAGVSDGPLPPQMPAGVRQMAPERVQEAMKVVEDWVAGCDEGGVSKL